MPDWMEGKGLWSVGNEPSSVDSQTEWHIIQGEWFKFILRLFCKRSKAELNSIELTWSVNDILGCCSMLSYCPFRDNVVYIKGGVSHLDLACGSI